MSTTSNASAAKVGRNLAIVAAVTACILLIPLVAMQFTSEVVWTLGDFVVAGALLFGTGAMYVFAASRARTPRQRHMIGFVLGGLLLLVWAELAVGIFD